MRNGLSFLILTPALVVGALLVAGCASTSPPAARAPLSPAADPAGPEGRAALLDRALPEVALQDLDGRPARLSEVLGGRPALVSLWATWCEACADEFAALARLHAGAAGRGAAVVGLAVGEPVATVAGFVRAQGFGWPQLCDPDFRFADALGEKRVPTTLVVGGSGRVTYVGGKLDGAALAALRAALSAGGPAPVAAPR